MKTVFVIISGGGSFDCGACMTMNNCVRAKFIMDIRMNAGRNVISVRIIRFGMLGGLLWF